MNGWRCLTPALAAPGGHPDIADAAAAMAERIVEDRPFAEGNTRAALLLVLLFLRLNGVDFRPSPAEASAAVAALAARSIDRETFADWIRTGP